MTKEVRLVFDISDVIGVRYQCTSETCKGEFLIKLEQDISMPVQCPLCGQRWESKYADCPKNPRSVLLETLRQILQDRERSGVSITLEMECDEETI